ncbi:hypothetical protein ACHQM5_014825 [Ranunculus cassubicifolius]
MTSSSSTNSDLPLRKIPGSYGIPYFSAVKDRLDYFYYQGKTEFFKSRQEKYQSTIFRHYNTPGPFMAPNSKVICLLDAISFPVLFDTTKVHKENGLFGTFMPSLSFYGGFAPLSCQDPLNPTHMKFKSLYLSHLASRHDQYIPLFQMGLSELFTNLESQLADKSSANFSAQVQNTAFDYIFRLVFNKNPTDTKLGSDGPGIISKWVGLQLSPVIAMGLPYIPDIIEDFLLRTFRLPFFLVKSDYKKLYDIVVESSTSILDKAEEMGLAREQTAHMLISANFFNGSLGIQTFAPILIKWIGLGGEKLHKQLADEIRGIVASSNGETLTVSDLEKMVLAKSVVYEALRIEAPITNQFGIAKKDLVIQNHENSFEIKKGEILMGFQPFASNDPKIFKNPDEFIADRFVGEDGEKLLEYMYWSGGRETENPRENTRQCPGKNMVLLIQRLMVAEIFLRYDTFTVEIGKSPLGSTVTIKSMTRRATTG